MPANLAAITTSVLVVFGVTPAALVLFATESVPVDVTAIGVMVALVVLGSWGCCTS